MTRKQIEAGREIRLWIRDIIVPAAIGAWVINAAHPEIKYKAQNKFTELKNKFKKN